jgi:hypothetical protein
MSDELRSASLLLAAITALRSDSGACDAAVPGQREAATEVGTCGAGGALLRFACGHGLVSSEEWLAVLSPLEGGNEHEVFQDPGKPGVIIKVTESNLRLRNGRDRIPQMTPLHYLERWHLANLAFGDAVELLAAIPTVEGVRLAIRQPFVAAADPESPNPDQQHINRWLRAAGFEYQSGAWVRQEDGLVMVDTHEGNFILAAAGLRPVDVELYRLENASGPVVSWEITQSRLITAGLEMAALEHDP